MNSISANQRIKFSNAFRFDVACHLAKLANDGHKITYGELAQRFGGIPRGWGDALGGIALRCKDNDLPLLSVLVVSSETDLPSFEADIYRHLGLSTPTDIYSEQQKCFSFAWKETLLGRDILLDQ